MLIKSVKVRLTLWYALVLTLFLSVFAFLMFAELSRALYDDVDQNMYASVKQVDESLRLRLFTHPTILRGLDQAAPADRMQPFSAEIQDIVDQTTKSWEKRFQILARSTHMMRIIGLDHAPVVSNFKGWEQDVIFPDFERDSIFMETGFSYQTIHFEKKPIRLYYHALMIREQPVLILQMGYSLVGIETTLNRLAFIIAIAIPVAVFFACLAGGFMARQFFKPVDNMIREARQITAAYLKSRLPRTFTGDELDRLAATLNEMMDRIEMSTRAVREFSSDVSHELKTPLAIIKGELDLAFRKSRTREELDQALKVIDGEVEEMIHLVSDLMVLVRSESGQIQFEKKEVPLHVIIEHVHQRFRERAVEKGVELMLGPEEPATVIGDEMYLKRLMSNLLDNAIKFTPEGGKIETGLHHENDCTVFYVKDSGIGMPEDVREKIFSRFYRGEKARSQEGAGLGMSIVKAIADAHAGVLDIQSQESVGTLVCVKFPTP